MQHPTSMLLLLLILLLFWGATLLWAFARLRRAATQLRHSERALREADASNAQLRDGLCRLAEDVISHKMALRNRERFLRVTTERYERQVAGLTEQLAKLAHFLKRAGVREACAEEHAVHGL